MVRKLDGDSNHVVFASVYVQILNVLNSLNVNTVYRATGNPDDDGYLTSPGAQPTIASQVSPQAYIDLYQIAAEQSK